MVTKLKFIHLTTNFYAMLAQKNFFMHLDSLILCIQSVITCYDSNFKFTNFKIFFTLDLESCTKMLKN